jgi:hypothetical protein
MAVETEGRRSLRLGMQVRGPKRHPGSGPPVETRCAASYSTHHAADRQPGEGRSTEMELRPVRRGSPDGWTHVQSGRMPPASATFERAGIAVTATYLGRGMWTFVTDAAASDGDHRFDNSAVSGAIRGALEVPIPVAPRTRIEVRAEHIRHGAIANNTFPPSAWWFDVDPGAGGVAPHLDAAIWECLSALRLSPSHRRSARSPFDDPRFGFAALNTTTDPTSWASDLACRALEWLDGDATIDDIHAFMHQLRALGHPLYSVDESDELATWSTWGPERPPRPFDVEVHLPPYEAPTVTVTVRTSDASPRRETT